MLLRFSPHVPGDLEQIADFIARDSPRQAIRMLRELRVRMKEIAKQPKLYRLRPELGEDARLAMAGRYVILFRVRSNSVRIERVLQGNRDLFRILEGNEN